MALRQFVASIDSERPAEFVDFVVKILAANDITELKHLVGASGEEMAYEEGETVSAGRWLRTCAFIFNGCFARQESVHQERDYAVQHKEPERTRRGFGSKGG